MEPGTGGTTNAFKVALDQTVFRRRSGTDVGSAVIDGDHAGFPKRNSFGRRASGGRALAARIASLRLDPIETDLHDDRSDSSTAHSSPSLGSTPSPGVRSPLRSPFSNAEVSRVPVGSPPRHQSGPSQSSSSYRARSNSKSTRSRSPNASPSNRSFATAQQPSASAAASSVSSFALPAKARNILRASKSPEARGHAAQHKSGAVGSTWSRTRKRYKGPRRSYGAEVRDTTTPTTVSGTTYASLAAGRDQATRASGSVFTFDRSPPDDDRPSRHGTHSTPALSQLLSPTTAGARPLPALGDEFSEDVSRIPTMRRRQSRSQPPERDVAAVRTESSSMSPRRRGIPRATSLTGTSGSGAGAKGSRRRSSPPDGASTVPLDKLSLACFSTIGTIGHGAFGKVMLVRDRGTKKTYALKVLSKSFVEHHGVLLNVKQEIETLKLCKDHPYIVQLHFVFQDDRNVYLVLDYARGGAFSSFINPAKTLSARQTLFYAAELVLCLGHLHKLGIVYFDLKLENILMTSSGHLKLADMGLSYPQDKLLAEAPVICGTPAYMAPEQVRCGGNGALSEEIQKTVDWWALGLVLYEMNTGRHPFHSGDDLQANFVKILQCEVEFRNMNEALAALIKALMHPEYRKRLGYGPRGTQNVKQHPAFNDRTRQHSRQNGSTRRASGSSGAPNGNSAGILVNWAALEARECKPACLPERRASIDKEDVSIEYKLDPGSRSNTAAHKEAAAFELSEAAQADFVKHIRPFRLDGSALSALNASPLERSKTEGPPPTGMSRSISVDSGMNEMDNLHLSPAAKQRLASHFDAIKPRSAEPSRATVRRRMSGPRTADANIAGSLRRPTTVATAGVPDELDLRVKAIDKEQHVWNTTPRDRANSRHRDVLSQRSAPE